MLSQAATLAPDLTRRMDPRAVRVGVLLAIIVSLNILDLLFTLLAHRVGLLKEMNPIAAKFFYHDMESTVVCYKALGILVGTFLLWKLRYSPWAPRACWLLVVVYTGLSFVWLDWSHHYVIAAEIEQTTPMLNYEQMRAAASLAVE